MDENFNENNWKSEGQKINLNIKNYENVRNFIKNNLPDEQNITDEKIKRTKELLEKDEKEKINKINYINEKTKNYTLPDPKNELTVGQNQPQDNILIQDLANNKEVLEQRRKQLESIHQTSAKIKDMSDNMAKQLDEQGAILDDIEENVNVAEANAEKAKEEITKANEISKGNRKKFICFIIIILVAVGAVSAILLSLIFH